jgi:hypothetical protein
MGVDWRRIVSPRGLGRWVRLVGRLRRAGRDGLARCVRVMACRGCVGSSAAAVSRPGWHGLVPFAYPALPDLLSPSITPLFLASQHLQLPPTLAATPLPHPLRFSSPHPFFPRGTHATKVRRNRAPKPRLTCGFVVVDGSRWTLDRGGLGCMAG